MEQGEGPPIESFSVIVTEANELCGQIHDRMPVIVEPEDYGAWLDPELKDPAYLLTQLPPQKMTARRVSDYVNNSRNEGPQCIAPPELEVDETFKLSV
jgi:putative SOS response-associated peptidase YedK